MLLAKQPDNRPTLLLVDDEPTNLQVLKQILSTDYRLLYARDGEKALQLAAQEKPDLILLDVMMPGLSGIDVCRTLKGTPALCAVPVIFVTALTDERNEAEGFAVGAVDYVTKPVSPMIVRARIRAHLSLVRVDELLKTRLEIVQTLGRAAEYKDNETGLHVMRMSHYSRVLARAAGMSAIQADDLLNAAPMHDVGKIGVADHILQKKGQLTPEEWAVMRRHPEMGAEIIGDHSSSLLQMARRVALYHHEKWNGQGYPFQLSGEQIPLDARIVAICDVFDALTSERPYKTAWSVEKAIGVLQAEAGQHFDPELVPLFIAQLPEILEIKARWAEQPTAG